jgi:hypothetical protein
MSSSPRKSKTVWERIKAIAKDEGIDISFDAVKELGVLALNQIIGG